MTTAIDLAEVLAGFDEPFAPRTVATLNDYDVRVVKTKGEFTSHSHPDTDEFFLVGGRRRRARPGTDVRRSPGRTASARIRGGAEVVLIEPSVTVNTGDTPSELTTERRVIT